MKKILFFLISLTVFFACKKHNTNLETGGMLHYDNFPDGWGLYYLTDSSEVLIFKSKYSSDSAEYEKYKQYVNLHTKLQYLYYGEKGCLYGFGPSCGHRVVDVIRLKVE